LPSRSLAVWFIPRRHNNSGPFGFCSAGRQLRQPGLFGHTKKIGREASCLPIGRAALFATHNGPLLPSASLLSHRNRSGSGEPDLHRDNSRGRLRLHFLRSATAAVVQYRCTRRSPASRTPTGRVFVSPSHASTHQRSHSAASDLLRSRQAAKGQRVIDQLGEASYEVAPPSNSK
jgi:hypothetical protein